MEMLAKIQHALELARAGAWEQASKILDGIAERERDRERQRTAKRHDLANLISIALANLEALSDGTLAVTPERLENICDSLRVAGKLLDELRERPMDPKTTTGQSKVYERYFLQCPYHLAQGYLARSVADRAESREPGVLTLRAPIAGADLSKNVVVTFATGSDPMHFDQPWKLHWTPEGGGPYPEFDGVLTVRADEDYTSAILELQGEYAPPGGAAGKLFDLALGSRIASATAQSLLKEIAVSMLEHYRRDESAKKGAGSGAA